VARLLVGQGGVVAISAVIAVSTFGTLNGSMMTAPRIFFRRRRGSLAAAGDRAQSIRARRRRRRRWC